MKDPLKIAAEVDHEKALTLATDLAHQNTVTGIVARAYIAQHAELVLLREVAEAAEIGAETLDKVLAMTDQVLAVTVNGVKMKFDATAEVKEALASWRSQTGGGNE